MCVVAAGGGSQGAGVQRGAAAPARAGAGAAQRRRRRVGGGHVRCVILPLSTSNYTGRICEHLYTLFHNITSDPKSSTNHAGQHLDIRLQTRIDLPFS